MKLELNDNKVRFGELNNYEDGKAIIQSLSQEAFDELAKMMGATNTGDQWYDYLVQLSMREDPEINDPFDKD